MNMKRIGLTQGKFTKVDNKDFEKFSIFKWQAMKVKKDIYRAGRRMKIDGKWKTIYLHREIIKAKKGQFVDHINHDQLDNRRSNLRTCTQHQSNMNRGFQGVSKTGFRGIGFVPGNLRKPWQSRIRVNKKTVSLGYFLTPREASEIHKKAARKYFGEFAYTFLDKEDTKYVES